MTLGDSVRDAKTVLGRVGRVPLLLIVVWLLAVWWGESQVFHSSVATCQWDRWETWHAGAQPHHVLLIADPQLVDPHTYPGRPWPLSSLTVVYTDLYLRRAYKTLLQQAQPDTTLFLGDLFDGGREWGVGASYRSPVDEFKGIGMDFWLREYTRFMNMFVTPWQDQGISSLPADGGRRFIASLPGNHDLGFAGGINHRVRSRFDAHFGPSNRMDILGNHTFVSLDTVSLSAMDEIDRDTGSSGAGDGTAPRTDKDKIWRPVEEFLHAASDLRDRIVRREARRLDPHLAPRHAKFPTDILADFEVSDVDKKLAKDRLQVATSQYPTIVLSHVPLFRSEAVSCGPHRERGTAIPLQAGYQYQNTLTPIVSKDIIDSLDAAQTVMIYSGDDHDYCEIEHDEYTGRVKEITVKSISWAMGIRRPGVQLVSLWNPVNLDTLVLDTNHDGRTILEQPSTPKGTVQNQLCLLPDQLSIFIHYAELLLVTLVLLSVRALRYHPAPSTHSDYHSFDKHDPILPTFRTRTPSPLRARRQEEDTSSSSTSTIQSSANQVRSTARKPQLGGYGNISNTSRSASPLKSSNQSQYQQGIPLISYAQNSTYKETDDWGMPPAAELSTRRHANARLKRQSAIQRWIRLPQSRRGALAQSLVHVTIPVLGLYFWLMWRF